MFTKAYWFAPGNWYLLWSHRHYITNFESFDAPWKILAGYLQDFVVVRQSPGERYLATGVLDAAWADPKRTR